MVDEKKLEAIFRSKHTRIYDTQKKIVSGDAIVFLSVPTTLRAHHRFELHASFTLIWYILSPLFYGAKFWKDIFHRARTKTQRPKVSFRIGDITICDDEYLIGFSNYQKSKTAVLSEIYIRNYLPFWIKANGLLELIFSIYVLFWHFFAQFCTQPKKISSSKTSVLQILTLSYLHVWRKRTAVFDFWFLLLLWCTKVPKLGAFLNLEDTIYVEFCTRAT